MLLARRKFIVSSLLFGASAFLVSGNMRPGLAQTLSAGRLSSGVLDDPAYRFSAETFKPYVGGYFESLGARGKMVALKLLSVDTFAAEKQTLTRAAVVTDSFSLLFSADGALPKFTSIYPIKHGALGEFDLFLTRRDTPSGEIRYEAVFNHLK